MSSTGIRGIRRKKSSLSEVKVAVLGAPGVGKSALTVRFLTKRYIGEYDHQSETRYKHETMVDGEPVIFEILDTCCKSLSDAISSETLQWADGFLLVYSITDRQSFNYIKHLKQQLLSFKNGETGSPSSSSLAVTSLPLLPCGQGSSGFVSYNGNNGSSGSRGDYGNNNCPSPMVLVANKNDMVHIRQISTEEGEILAKDLDCTFAEVAASEQVTQVADVFHDVCRDIQAARKKTKQSLLDRVLGNKAAAGLRVYARGKSDSALPKESS